MTGHKILTRIIEKGGVLGECARIWRNDEEKVNLYIKECSEMCHTELAMKLWGKDLVTAILRHSKSLNFQYKRVSEFNLRIIKTIKELRKRGGIKQDVIAHALNMTQSNYSRIEDGLRPITLDQFNIIAQTLNLSPADLLSYSSAGKTSS